MPEFEYDPRFQMSIFDVDEDTTYCVYWETGIAVVVSWACDGFNRSSSSVF